MRSRLEALEKGDAAERSAHEVAAGVAERRSRGR